MFLLLYKFTVCALLESLLLIKKVCCFQITLTQLLTSGFSKKVCLFHIANKLLILYFKTLGKETFLLTHLFGIRILGVRTGSFLSCWFCLLGYWYNYLLLMIHLMFVSHSANAYVPGEPSISQGLCSCLMCTYGLC